MVAPFSGSSFVKKEMSESPSMMGIVNHLRMKNSEITQENLDLNERIGFLESIMESDCYERLRFMQGAVWMGK